MNTLYLILLAVVIIGHCLFAYMQWARWPQLSARLTDLDQTQRQATAFLGRSIGSYNASIAIGLCLSFWLHAEAQYAVQGVVLALIVATAIVGSMGTKGKGVLFFRLLPAALALVVLMIIRMA